MEPTAPAKPRYWQGIYLDRGETPVTIIHKHPIGVVAIILVGLAAVAAAVVFFIFLFPNSFSDNPTGAAGGLFLFSAVVALIVLIAIYIYRQNRLLVTNKHLAQVTQRTLVMRKISQLSMSNVEDANADQRGILATIFNYGTLTVQTAGEMENFIFTLCPNPNKYSDQILEARQAFAQDDDADPS
jgi:membrane protein YdbS with pleckstrin-like domain